MERVTLMLAIALAACSPGANGSGLPEQSGPWELRSIDGTAFEATARIEFGADDQIRGRAPCNTFSGQLDAAPPGFAISNLVRSGMHCDEMDAEERFLSALQEMDASSMRDAELVLSSGAGREMVFRIQDAR